MSWLNIFGRSKDSSSMCTVKMLKTFMTQLLMVFLHVLHANKILHKCASLRRLVLRSENNLKYKSNVMC